MDTKGMEPPAINLQAPLEPALVGCWRSCLNGTGLDKLTSVEPRSMLEIVLDAEGTAEWRWPKPQNELPVHEPEPPFPTTWETSPDGTLTIYLPIAPMPEYEIMDWIREAVRYDVLSITPDTLTLSNRRYDGESITVYRRQPTERSSR
jgi:hypothetical protein